MAADLPLGSKGASGSITSDAVDRDEFHSTYIDQMGAQEAKLEDDELYQTRRALALSPVDDPERPEICSILAVLLWDRFEDMGNEALLYEAIALEREALSLTPKGHPDRARLCTNLALSLNKCFDHTRDENSLDEAIHFQREAVALRPRGHLSRGITCSSLAVMLATRYEYTEDENLLDEAIALDKEALFLTPTWHPDRGIACINLAVSLKSRFAQTGEVTLLHEALVLQKEALSITPTDHPNRPLACLNLAVSLATEFERTGDERLLDEAISLDREALSLTPNGHRDRPRSCSNLAVVIATHFERTGDDKLLTEIIALEREALSLRPADHPDRARSCNNLAVSLQFQFSRNGDVVLLHEAISLQREALSIRSLGHPDRARSCSNLAVTLMTCYEHSGNMTLLDEAIILEREALSLTPQNHPNRGLFCTDLAGFLQQRSAAEGNNSVLIEIEGLYCEALEESSPQHASHWRALTGLARWHLDRRHYDVDRVLGYLEQAISPKADGLPQLLSEVTMLLELVPCADLSVSQQHKLLHLYASSIDLSSLVAGYVLDQSSQLKYLITAQHLGPGAFLIATCVGKLEVGLQLLERTRGMMWSQMLQMRDPQLQDLPPDLAVELGDLLRSMAIGKTGDPRYAPTFQMGSGSSALTSHDLRHQRHSQIQQLIQTARSLPGHADFLRGPSLQAILSTGAEHPVVVLMAARSGCQAVVIHKGSLTLLPLQTITLDDVEAAKLSVLLTPQKRGCAQKDTESLRLSMKSLSSQDPSRFSRTLSRLWTAVVKPVLISLGISKSPGKLRPRIYWCPTGPFAFAPIHAAGIYEGPYQECCSDYAVSSYTPTLAALQRARTDLPTIAKEGIELALFAAREAQDANLPTLWNVESELDNIVIAAEKAHVSIGEGLESRQATTELVVQALASADLVHIACHGIQNTFDALSSGFCLCDGHLTVSQLMELDLRRAFLAFLSACETAAGDKTQPDQVVHLAAAMLFVGFRSVVATMWAMNDTDGPRVARFFYDRLFEGDQITADAVPYALDYAITELRRSGVPPQRWATFIHMGA